MSNLSKICFLLFILFNNATAESAKYLVGKGVKKAHNIEKLMVPASIQKVFTMYLAWNILTPSYTFNTKLVKLENNLYQINFTFDPSLKIQDLEKIIWHLPKNQKIKLKLVSNGLTQPINPHWEKSDTMYCYAAPLGPAIINENCMPYTKNIQGKKVTSKSPYQAYKTLPGDIQRLAKIKNIKIEKIEWVMHESPGKIIYSHRSQELSILMKSGLKKSNNIVMDSLWLACAQKLAKTKKITWQSASNILSNYIKNTEIKFLNHMVMKDGSGLSPHNRVSAQLLNSLLHNIERNPSMYKWALNAFPKAAVDGTLKTRFHSYKSYLKHCKIIAKTGTFKSVRNYSGWIISNHGHSYRFIWLENVDKTKSIPIKKQEKEIMNFIVNVIGYRKTRVKL